MNSHVNARFRKAFALLPLRIQQQARQAYRIFVQNPYDPRLHFRQVHPSRPIFSVRINEDYCAVGVRDGQDIVWFWIGGHEEYDKLLDRL